MNTQAPKAITHLIHAHLLNASAMLHNLCLIQGNHLPTQQAPELGTDHFLLLRAHSVCHRFSDGRTSIRACSGASGTRIFGSCRLPLPDIRRGKAILPVNSLYGSLKAAEESFSADESGLEVDRVREFVDCFQVNKNTYNLFMLYRLG